MKNLLVLILAWSQFSAGAQNLQFRSVTSYNEDLSDVWGWSDGTREYAIVGFKTGFSIVEVTDPDNPSKLHEIDGPSTIWRDIKTFGSYAYGVHEDVGTDGQGLVIMDLSGLPGELNVSNWNTDGTPEVFFRNAHNIFIDEQGIAYLVGSNVTDGVLMLDLSIDPENPVVVGQYTDFYVHDCFARNDTLWTAEVDAGEFAALDITTKANAVSLARQETPLSFTHNIWLSDDGRTAFTTDERSNGPIAAYDVSDLSDIKLLDSYRSNPEVIPHNVTVLDDFVVASVYRDGIIILDTSFPDEMVEVGRYDTAPSFSGDGFNGCWGVYPYLPSGNILASDIERGLFVLTPTYQKAVHIRGTVRNADTGDELSEVLVEVSGVETDLTRSTNLEGKFKVGLPNDGNYRAAFKKAGFQPVVVETDLNSGEVEIIDLEMSPVELMVADTIYAEAAIGSSLEICVENSGLNADLSYTCDLSGSSDFGAWNTDNSECLTYTPGNTGGEFIDTLCFVLTDSENDENHVTLVIVSISGISTGTTDLQGRDGWKLLENPVQQSLSILHPGTTGNNVLIRIFDTHGQQLITQVLSAGTTRSDIPVSLLGSGLYIAAFSMDGSVDNYLKFVKF